MKLYNIKSNGGLTKCNLIWWVFNTCFWRTLVSQFWTWDVYLQVMCASVTLLHSEHPGAVLLGCSLFSYLQEVRDTRETCFRIIKQQSHKGSNFLCTQPKHHSDTSCLDSEKKKTPKHFGAHKQLASKTDGCALSENRILWTKLSLWHKWKLVAGKQFRMSYGVGNVFVC